MAHENASAIGRNDQATVPACPGCHLGCSLDAYACGRGLAFNRKWQAGEEIPERRLGGPGGAPKGRQDKPQDGTQHGGRNPEHTGGPGLGGGQRPGGHPVLPVNDRVMHALEIATNVLKDRKAGTEEQQVLDVIMRQGKMAAPPIIKERTRLSESEIEQLADALESKGLVSIEEDASRGFFAHITDAGIEQANAWTQEREARDEEFLSGLDEDEKVQLAELLFKMLMAARR